MKQIYTIGHSTDTIKKFIEHLEHFQIDTIIDVRSVPYSRFASQFNKEQLSASLKKKNIIYIPMGDDLGGRYDEKKLLFEDGKVDFSKVVNTNRFQGGINRIKSGMQKGHSIALMCSEKNPLECHRFSLISNYLLKSGYIVNHIVGKDIYTHKLLESKLINYYKEHHKISTDINRIIKFDHIQNTLFDIDNIDENDLYFKLNRLVGYSPTEVKIGNGINLYTIGFSKKSAEEFFKILKSNNVIRLIDVRLNNKSQLAGFTNVKHLPYFLKIHDIEYLYKPDFAPSKELLNGYKNKSVSWEEYEIEYNKILVQRSIIKKIEWNIFKDSVLLCSEPTEEQCHRRLLAEFLAEKKSEIIIKHL